MLVTPNLSASRLAISNHHKTETERAGWNKYKYLLLNSKKL